MTRLQINSSELNMSRNFHFSAYNDDICVLLLFQSSHRTMELPCSEKKNATFPNSNEEWHTWTTTREQNVTAQERAYFKKSHKLNRNPDNRLRKLATVFPESSHIFTCPKAYFLGSRPLEVNNALGMRTESEWAAVATRKQLQCKLHDVYLPRYMSSFAFSRCGRKKNLRSTDNHEMQETGSFSAPFKRTDVDGACSSSYVWLSCSRDWGCVGFSPLAILW